MRPNIVSGGLALAAFSFLPLALSAQDADTERWLDQCRRRDGDRARHCEAREYTLPAGGSLQVTAAPNGSVQVTAWDRSEIRVVARIQAQAPEAADAEALAGEVTIDTDGGVVRARGPRTSGHRSWWVSYDVRAPAGTDLELESVNGALSVKGISGDLRLETENGAIAVDGAAGSVHAETTNGGIDIVVNRLGSSGVRAETTNGGIELVVPSGVNADLEASTVNGGLDVGFPVQVQGRIGRRVRTTLGSGGPAIMLETTNGGIRISKGRE